jgi:iron complex outermembrane receptor protein
VLWESQDTILDDIERIEVIRGPGAAIWGANAVNGVINIITRSARDTTGVLLQGDTGTGELAGVATRYGARAGAGWARAYAKVERRGANTGIDGRDAADDSRAARAGFRYDREEGTARATLQGEAFRVNAGDRITSGIVTPPYSRSQVEREEDQGFHLLGRWSGAPGGVATTLQAYYDYSDIKVPVVTFARRRTVDLDVNVHFPQRGGHDFIAGFGYRMSRDSTRDAQLIRFDPSGRTLTIASAFVQDEIALAPDWKLTVGAKLEHHTFTGADTSPNARLLWNVAPGDSAWIAVSRAVRTPSRGERDALFNWDVIPPDPRQPGLAGMLPVQTVIAATHNLDAERLTAAEFGYRGKLAPALALDFAAFHNRYRGLIRRAADPALATVVPANPPYIRLPVILGNRSTVNTQGYEIALDYRPREWWRLQAGYSRLWMDLDRQTDLENIDGSTPRYLASLRSAMDLGGVQLDLWLRRIGERPMYFSPAQRVPAYTNLDARVAWRPAPGWEAALGAQNLLDRRYQQFYADKVTSTPLQARRMLTARLTYAY